MLRVSLVPCDIPPLMSRAVLRYLGAALVLKKMTVRFQDMGHVTAPLEEMDTGHVALDVMRTTGRVDRRRLALRCIIVVPARRFPLRSEGKGLP